MEFKNSIKEYLNYFIGFIWMRQEKKWLKFVNRSTTIRIIDLPFETGRPSTESIAISCQGLYEIGKVCNRPPERELPLLET